MCCATLMPDEIYNLAANVVRGDLVGPAGA